jgi:glutaredoxin
MIAVTLYSRPGCHLCDEMKALVTKVARRIQMSIAEIDITTDPALERQYGEEIPVLMIDGSKAAKYRIDEQTLLRILAGRRT